MNSKPLNVIDLFCGAGGMSYGFQKAGFEVVLGIDNWQDSLNTFQRNHKNASTMMIDLSVDLHKTIDAIVARASNIDVIIGGPPCQGFSIAGKRMIEDPRNTLYKSFVTIVEKLQPKAFIMENVANLASMKGGDIKRQIIEDFSKSGYQVYSQILKASDYGVPQNRRRLIIVGLRNNISNPFEYPLPDYGIGKKEYISSSEALSDLPEHTLSDGEPYPSLAHTEYQAQLRQHSNYVYNHQTTNHTSQTTQIISLVPDGGNYKDLPEKYRKTRNVNIAWTRLDSNKPSFTIDTGHRHHFHYKWNRVPTVRESARLQSFPDTFIFEGSKTSQYRQVGNAVPPILATKLAKSLLKVL